MKPKITDPLIKIPDDYPHEVVDMKKLEQEYGADKVKEAIEYLTYRNVEELRKNEDEGTPILYVFRHGQTIDNANIIFCGWRDVGLTKEGVKQAEALIDQLKDKKIQMLISSDMIRAIDTMKLAIQGNEQAKSLELVQDTRIRERSYGDWQGHSKLVKHLEDPKALLKVRRGYDNPPPNGESLKDTVDRVYEFLDEILPLMKKQKINAAISCHGNSIRGIRKYFENLSEKETALIETPLGQDYAAYSVT